MNGNPIPPIALVPIGTDTLEVNLSNYRNPTSSPALRAGVSPAFLQRLQRIAGHAIEDAPGNSIESPDEDTDTPKPPAA